VNQYETQAIEDILCKRGHELAAPGEGCDICILNTCAVTAESVRKSRQQIRRMKKLEPGAKIAVFGCYSQLEPEAVKKLGADLISGTEDRYGFALLTERMQCERCNDIISSLPPGGMKKPSGFTAPTRSNESFNELPPGNAVRRTRALLKIQDGCDKYCAYCVVPYTRGCSRSLPVERVAEYAKQLGGQGYKEIVITGIEIAAYGKDLTPQPSATRLIDAITAVRAAAPDARLRLGSLDPCAVTDEFCENLSNITNICNHFHLSLQSGSDQTLKRMGRKYEAKQVKQAIDTLRSHFDDCAITADLIAGFPGETEAEFGQTLKFIKAAKFANMHIFPFSRRPGTRAADMPGQIKKGIIKERIRKVTGAAAAMASEYRQAQIGKTVEVLFERKKNGLSRGHSSNYLEVEVTEKAERNSMYKVLISGAENGLLQGEIQGEIV